MAGFGDEPSPPRMGVCLNRGWDDKGSSPTFSAHPKPRRVSAENAEAGCDRMQNVKCRMHNPGWQSARPCQPTATRLPLYYNCSGTMCILGECGRRQITGRQSDRLASQLPRCRHGSSPVTPSCELRNMLQVLHLRSGHRLLPPAFYILLSTLPALCADGGAPALPRRCHGVCPMLITKSPVVTAFSAHFLSLLLFVMDRRAVRLKGGCKRVLP
jgi:hypothetical protein